jgi:CRP-like cAMP-binding protein
MRHRQALKEEQLDLMGEPEPTIDARHLITLRAAPEFVSLDADVIAALAQIFEEKLYPRGGYLTRSGVPVDAVSFILEGRVKVDRPKPSVLDHGPVGLPELFAEDGAGLEARAETDVRALTAPSTALRDLMEVDFGFLSGALEGLARGNLDLISQLGDDRWLLPPFEHPVSCPDQPLRLAERIMWLSAALYFAQSRVEAVAEIARVSSEARHGAGTPIWKSGDDSQGFLLIVAGEIDCAGKFGTTRARAGQALGGLETMARLPHWYDATVVTPVRALVTERDAVLDVIEDQVDLGADLVRNLAARFIALRDGAVKS